jgi:hypothetical protein
VVQLAAAPAEICVAIAGLAAMTAAGASTRLQSRDNRHDEAFLAPFRHAFARA